MLAILGGIFWIASVAWYAQQPTYEDELKEGWETFNRLTTTIPILFAPALYGMHLLQAHKARRVESLALRLVLLGTLVIGGVRLLVDIGVLPSPIVLLAIIIYILVFIWFLVETLMADVLSRAPVLCLLTSTLVMAAFVASETQLIWLASFYAVAWIILGFLLWKGTLTKASEPVEGTA